MKQIAIVHDGILQAQNPALRVNPSHVQSFDINRYSVSAGLIETLDTPFDAQHPAYQDQVLVKKRAFSCNYRDKALVLKAKHRIDSFAESSKVKFYTMGSEFVGEVVAVGSQVKHLTVGDRVIGNGNYPYSGYQDVRPGLPTNHGSKELEVFHHGKLVTIPNEMSDEIAAGFPIGGQTSYSMIRKLNLSSGERVLVTAGTSNTSMFAIAALKHLPVEVCVLTTRDTHVEKLKALGADRVFVIERGLQSFKQAPEVIKDAKLNGPYNAVIDPFFDIYLGQVVDVMAIESRYVTCGMYAQPYVADEAVMETLPNNMAHVLSHAMMKNMQIIGNCIGKTSDLEKSIEDYASGKLEVVIDQVYTDNQIGEFFDRSFNSSDRFGKVIYKYL
ncbi:zinc-binding alcohol dehydrogenase family protein [Pontibacter sp. G13]|uniref:quinone oxidoreductase family protein n=1 Tax=Pontibacter sp. G13 TaxID=3074898 RepID=UPI00288BB892|nr:zinc-binding alcohol dehydrogenase family protein [Pontibacter sp. G13]WNJ16378.1 zinc-binding alcohol dehydrogenase family protein [Pontibacter sp. G13]